MLEKNWYNANGDNHQIKRINRGVIDVFYFWFPSQRMSIADRNYTKIENYNKK